MAEQAAVKANVRAALSRSPGEDARLGIHARRQGKHSAQCGIGGESGGIGIDQGHKRGLMRPMGDKSDGRAEQ